MPHLGAHSSSRIQFYACSNWRGALGWLPAFWWFGLMLSCRGLHQPGFYRHLYGVQLASRNISCIQLALGSLNQPGLILCEPMRSSRMRLDVSLEEPSSFQHTDLTLFFVSFGSSPWPYSQYLWLHVLNPAPRLTSLSP